GRPERVSKSRTRSHPGTAPPAKVTARSCPIAAPSSTQTGRTALMLLISLAAALAASLNGGDIMTTDNRTVVGVFTDRGHAEGAMDALRHELVPAHDIGFLSPTGSGTADETPTARVEHRAEEGAVTGAVTGGAVGALAGAVAVGLIPGIGQV